MRIYKRARRRSAAVSFASFDGLPPLSALSGRPPDAASRPDRRRWLRGIWKGGDVDG